MLPGIQKRTSCFRFQEIATNALNLPPTKFNILEICNTFFNPLGVLSPIVLQAKLILRNYVLTSMSGTLTLTMILKSNGMNF